MLRTQGPRRCTCGSSGTGKTPTPDRPWLRKEAWVVQEYGELDECFKESASITDGPDSHYGRLFSGLVGGGGLLSGAAGFEPPQVRIPQTKATQS